VLDYERKLTLKYRAEHKNVIRPSTLFLIAIGFFYITSPIDLIPERWVGAPWGYIDDLIVAIFVSARVIMDLSDVRVVMPDVKRILKSSVVKNKEVEEEEAAEEEELEDKTIPDDVEAALNSLKDFGKGFKDATSESQEQPAPTLESPQSASSVEGVE
jgi:uncharacterized membrane protein YkvA (DUF1232 family)